MTKEKYLEMCRVMKKEPDPDIMPLDFEDFPSDIQELFVIVNMLPDRWDGMSGAYLGKDFSLIPYLFDVYNIENAKTALIIINLIISESSRIYNDKLKQQHKTKGKKK